MKPDSFVLTLLLEKTRLYEYETYKILLSSTCLTCKTIFTYRTLVRCLWKRTIAVIVAASLVSRQWPAETGQTFEKGFGTISRRTIDRVDASSVTGLLLYYRANKILFFFKECLVVNFTLV